MLNPLCKFDRLLGYFVNFKRKQVLKVINASLSASIDRFKLGAVQPSVRVEYSQEIK